MYLKKPIDSKGLLKIINNIASCFILRIFLVACDRLHVVIELLSSSPFLYGPTL